MKHSLLVLSILLVAFCLPARGEDVSPIPEKAAYSIQELVERSVANYELLKASETSIEQYRLHKEQAAAWRNPEIEINGGMKKDPSTTGYLYGLSLTQSFLYPGKLNISREIISHDEVMARLSHEEMRLYVSYEVIRLAFRYRAMKEKSLHSRDRLRRLRIIETYLKSRPILSPEKIVEKNIIQARVKMLEKEMVEVEQGMRLAFSELNLFTCFCVEENRFPEITMDWYNAVPVIDEAALRDRALKNNHALLIQREMISKSKTMTAYEQKKNNPDIGLSLFFTEEKLAEREQSFGGGVTLPIPVLDRNSQGIKASTLRTEQEKQHLQFAERNLNRVLSNLFAEYGTASKLLQKFPMNEQEEIERAMRFADGEFMRGRVGLQTYLEMDTQSHEVLEAMYSTQIRLIDAYTGILYQSAEKNSGRIFTNDK